MLGQQELFPQEIAEKYKNKINYLVEPSKDAIRLCKEKFKRLPPLKEFTINKTLKKNH